MPWTDALLTGPRLLLRMWRRSLLLRVTATTLVLSAVVMTVLGFSLLSRVTTGLLSSKDRIAVGEAAAGLGEAQRLLDAADTGPTTPSASRLVDSVVSALASRAGSPGQFDVLLLSSSGAADEPERGTNLVAVSSVPTDLRAAVVSSQRQSWTYSEIRFLDGRTTPGLVIGAPLDIPTVGAYELYYLFPLAQEQDTLDLVRGAVVLTGVLLVGLLAFVAWLVTRQVVAPVRAAAQTASRFSEGHLSERVRVKGDDDLARLASSFNGMAASLQRQIKQLEGLSRVQQRFVSDVSHELRTPLTTIRMAADVMFEHRSEFEAPTARAAELLQTQLDRFEALLVDLLEISRFDAGAAVLDADQVDVASLVGRVLEGSGPLADRLGTSLRLHAEDGQYLVNGDSRRIDRIVRNLIDNAVEHGGARGIDVTVGKNETAVAVTVRDYGVGLRPGESSLVFNRFWRADPARARTTGGTGLGLAISLEDARLHGGWLEAWGEPGRGACFRLTLPRRIRTPIAESPLPLAPDDLASESTLEQAPAAHVPGATARIDATARFAIESRSES
ncbi:MAG: HAMP domain-containing protein [Actinobacteria bacterium]|uniref:Sensor histidine kinase MtrB n=1 Tax=freshwater metagenome TaxID=449393 RepID=A0A6J7EB96_9ZZZZ|nr:HAMP domain-containing protein [Actinomycetota bacterium]